MTKRVLLILAFTLLLVAAGAARHLHSWDDDRDRHQINCLDDFDIEMDGDVVILTSQDRHRDVIEITRDLQLSINGDQVEIDSDQTRLVGRFYDDVVELEEYAERLTIRDATGLQQIGFLPWQPWDHSIMWGYLFGGQWYGEQTGLMACAGDPNIIRMFRWQQSFARDPSSNSNPSYAMDPEKIMSFQQGFGAYMSANNPFYSGKIAMIAEGAILGIELPATVNLEITDTAPAMKAASSSARTKPATLSTGLVVQVPEYLTPGEIIKVNTATGEFVSRA